MSSAATPGPDIDAPCPACGYSLRGLVEMRCPACGRPFEWLDVLVPGSGTHPYLFEHHPRRNFWSFRRTAWGGLRPRHFWSPLHPAHPSRPGRLLAYWAVTTGITLLGALAPYAAGRAGGVHEGRLWTVVTRPGGMKRTCFRPVDSYFDLAGFGRVVRDIGPLWLAWWAWGVIWPWLTVAALMFLRRLAPRSDLGSCFVTPLSLLRCTLYSVDVLLWAGLLLLPLSALGPAVCFRRLHVNWPVWLRGAVPAAVLFGFGGWCVYKLAVGLEAYLRVNRPWRWVFASQVLVLATGGVAAGFLRLFLR